MALALHALSRSTRSHGPYLAREERRRGLDALGVGDEGAFDLLSAHRNFWGQFHHTGEEEQQQHSREEGEEEQQQQQHSHDAEAAETPQATKTESVASPPQDGDGAKIANSTREITKTGVVN